MLFDLRGRGRRRTVQVIYLTLAILLGGGLVLFGIGGDVQGGLVDVFTGGGGGGGDNDLLEDDVKKAQKRVDANAQDAAAWAELAEAKHSLAGVTEGYDETTGTYGGKARAVALDATRAWEQHVKLAKGKPDADTGRLITQTYISLDQAEKAVQAWAAVTDAMGDDVDWKDLSYYAELAYIADQPRVGDRATQAALDRAKEQNISKERRDQEKAGLEQLKQQLEQQQVQEAQGGAGGATPQTPVAP
jgi:hypothetical protein